MARGIFSLAVLVGLLLLAFVLREFTSPWGVGRELEKHENKLTALEDGVAKSKELGVANQGEIEKHRRLLAEHAAALAKQEKAIEENTSAIAQNSEELGRQGKTLESHERALAALKLLIEEAARELKALYESTVRDNGRLSQEVLELRDSSRKLEGRLKVIEEKLQIGEAAPGTVQ